MTLAVPTSSDLCHLAPTHDAGVFACDDAEGISRVAVLSMAQDERGYLWLGTEEGPIRFDGRGWGMPSGFAPVRGSITWAFDTAEPNALWVGTDGAGLWLLDTCALPNRLRTTLTAADGLADDDIHVLCRDGAGALWVGTHHGLSIVDGQRVAACFTAADGIPESGICALCAGGGTVWAGSLHGLLVFQGRTLRRQLSVADGLPDAAVYALHADAAGRIWAGTRQGIAVIEDGTVRAVIRDGLPAAEVRALCRDRGGRMWAATAQGLALIEELEVRAAWTRRDGLPSSSLWALLCDRENRVWVGTDGGLAMLPREASPVRSLPLDGEAVSSFAVDGSRRTWIGTGRGLAVIAADGRTEMTPPALSSESMPAGVWALYHDGCARLWAGGRHGGLFCVDCETGQTVAHVAEINAVLCLSGDAAGRLWAGMHGAGLACVDAARGLVLRRVTVAQGGLPCDHVAALCIDRLGRLWVGTLGGGIARVNPTHATVEWLLGDAGGLPNLFVTSLALDDAGALWAGTQGGGLACIDLASERVVGVWTTADGLPSDSLHSCAFDGAGALWIGTARGLARYDPATGRCIALGRAHGMASDYCQQGALRVDAQRRLWVGTANGAAVVRPDDVSAVMAPCASSITGFYCMGQEREAGPALEIAETDYDLLFEFGAVAYVAPAQVMYRTQLAGLEPEWSRPQPHRFARYMNLRPGAYTFRVCARNWGGQWSAPAELPFRVVPDAKAREMEETLERQRIEMEVQRATAQRLEELNKTLVTAQLLQMTLYKQLRRQAELLEQQAREDGLTGVLNRRALDERLEAEYARSRRRRRPLTIALMDVDRFKAVNDVYSHQAGDAVLKAIALLCMTQLRPDDAVGRYGGEEFALILPGTRAQEAHLVCERLRRAIADFAWDGIAPGLRITVSMGLAVQRDGLSPSDLLAEADTCLYRAKRAGRNRICCVA